jgi:hypothetical protein
MKTKPKLEVLRLKLPVKDQFKKRRIRKQELYITSKFQNISKTNFMMTNTIASN